MIRREVIAIVAVAALAGLFGRACYLFGRLSQLEREGATLRACRVLLDGLEEVPQDTAEDWPAPAPAPGGFDL